PPTAVPPGMSPISPGRHPYRRAGGRGPAAVAVPTRPRPSRPTATGLQRLLRAWEPVPPPLPTLSAPEPEPEPAHRPLPGWHPSMGPRPE
ncbi:MAG TPA: hypothetical protein VHL53_20845, partial [Acidimicrobiia bacterium]|nr:hypothetical protein [Acidimicrobiia bacterium]